MRNLASYIDHTLLKAEATGEDIERCCEEAIRFGFHSVCVHGSRVARAVAVLRGTSVRVAAVTGFPLGAMTTRAKAFESAQAVEEGAEEIDTVLAVGALKEGDFAYVLQDIRHIVEAACPGIVKVILETGLLTLEEKRVACEIAREAGAAFVKTSTGFGKGGATVEDVRLMKEAVRGGCLVKASGGIRDQATALAMIEAGASRLGTSSGIAIVSGSEGKSGY